LHAGLANKARVFEDTVFVQLDHGPDTDGLLRDLHLLAFELVVVEEVTVLARVELIGEEG